MSEITQNRSRGHQHQPNRRHSKITKAFLTKSSDSATETFLYRDPSVDR